ncbi:lipoxygenase family protein [Archangium violaceum]|uniref:Lipoxygenase n=1 Tax=Archangium violaceum Cb vi76 TaxID=1406225 RepID=A0A084SUN4_9BACT|nr:lipoxygenase family protein [Archangium violaceum]KFA92169.1 lipoxygenase [Archangium violaceum Cb vi76]
MLLKYKITIQTSSRSGAGTDADVFVSLIGTEGRSEQHRLNSRFRRVFKTGARDVFTVTARDVGELVALRFSTSKRLGLGGDWRVDTVRVEAEGHGWFFPHFRWILANSTVDLLEGTARLPQHTRGEQRLMARREQIENRRRMYPWCPAPSTSELPGSLDVSKEQPLPKDERYRGLREGGYTGVMAMTLARMKLGRPGLASAWNGLVNTVELLDSLEKPKAAQLWQDDHEFARQAVQGVCPLHIQSISALPERFPLTDSEVRGLLSPGTTLAQALADRRVFLLDFEILDDIPMFHKVDEKGEVERRWAPSSRCLLYLDDTKHLRPLAIQLGRHPERDQVFTPNDSDTDWLAAKVYVRCSEGNVHQMVSHAIRTHFVAEPFVMVTMRNLPDCHPVYKLLRHHFRYTLAINDKARRGLLDAGGVFDDFIATGGPARGHIKLGKKGYSQWKLLDNKPRLDFERRGVLDPAVLPYYPYRDDTLPLWDALEEYVGGVLGVFYKSDTELVKDSEMQAWWAELLERGLPVEKLPCAKLESVSELVDILTIVLFTVSVQHAAVNYLQYEHYAFVPNAPLCMRQPPPRARGRLTRQALAEMMPDKDQTLWQITVGRALSSFGEDEEFLLHPGGWREDSFDEPEVAAVRERFRARLKAQLEVVNARNAQSPSPYTVLRPDRIPTGITI